MEGVDIGTTKSAGARGSVDVSPCTVRVYGNSKKLALFWKKGWIALDKYADTIYNGGNKGKRKCQMENENEDSQQTKRSENGTLCIGQKDSQKDSDFLKFSLDK